MLHAVSFPGSQNCKMGTISTSKKFFQNRDLLQQICEKNFKKDIFRNFGNLATNNLWKPGTCIWVHVVYECTCYYKWAIFMNINIKHQGNE